jgi:hypothetical protein
MSDGAPRTRVCPQCKEAFTAAGRGRVPTYCGASCRKAAWEARKLKEAIAAAVEAERARSTRGNELATRGNEWPGPVEVEGEECPYCRDVVADLVPHLQLCPDGPGAHIA